MIAWLRCLFGSRDCPWEPDPPPDLDHDPDVREARRVRETIRRSVEQTERRAGSAREESRQVLAQARLMTGNLLEDQVTGAARAARRNKRASTEARP